MQVLDYCPSQQSTKQATIYGWSVCLHTADKGNKSNADHEMLSLFYSLVIGIIFNQTTLNFELSV